MRELLEQSHSKLRLNMQQFEAQFDAADTNGDRSVNFDEFVVWFNGFNDWARMMAATAERDGAAKRMASGRAVELELTEEDQALVFEMMHYDAKTAERKSMQRRTEAKAKHGAMAAAAIASREQLIDLLVKRPSMMMTDDEKGELRKIYMTAVSGDAYGAAGTGYKSSFQKANRSGRLSISSVNAEGETGREDALDGKVNTARMNEQECTEFARLIFDLRKGQEGFFGPMLFRSMLATRENSDGQISFAEMVGLIGPLAKGCISQRAAFIFGCYDVDSSGLLTQKEIYELACLAPVDGDFERDLVQLMRHERKKAYTLADYIRHVKAGGECGVVARMHRQLGINVTMLPTDEKILGTS